MATRAEFKYGTYKEHEITSKALKRDNLLLQDVAEMAKCVEVPLVAGAADAIIGYWSNPLGKPCVVSKVLVRLKEAGGTATSVIDVGTARAKTTGSDNLIDGADANAVALYDNVTNKGANGKTLQFLPEDSFVTAQLKVEKADDLEGSMFITYTDLPSEVRRVDSVVVTGTTPVESDNAAKAGTYTATLSDCTEGVPVLFTLATFLAGDLAYVKDVDGNALSIAGLLAAGVSVDSNSAGKAVIEIGFKANVSKTGNLTGAISDTDDLVRTTDSDALSVVVDTTADGG